MHETDDDLARLQRVLDDSYAAGGPHMRAIVSEDRRVSAAALAERLVGVRLLVLGTTTADGRPITSPVDGIFYRGAFHFGSSPESVRIRHLRARPAVSATHLPGEELSVSVHGRAVEVDVHAPEHAGFKETLLGIYVPRYGESWGDMLDGGAVYMRIEADKVLTFDGEGL
jgi:nitroimidazol reductase NimA-like FMN-containing flavoprotein (pyridoxamine 5'-phosphate oxidase superfamily)